MATVSSEELTFTQAAVNVLTADARGKKVLARARKANALPEQLKAGDGISNDTAATLFELRVAAALCTLTTAAWEYEHPAGVGLSSVDFYVPGPPNWLIEVVSLRTSLNAEGGMSRSTDWRGITWSSSWLSSDKPVGKGSFEKEMLLAESKILEKVSKSGQPWKFPPLSTDTFHAVVVDARGYLGDGGGDEFDYVQMTGGRAYLGTDAPYQALNGEAIKGVFEPDNPLAGAALACERLHLTVFVEELGFDGRRAHYLSLAINNPHLLPTLPAIREAFATYPLRACHKLKALVAI